MITKDEYSSNQRAIYDVCGKAFNPLISQENNYYDTINNSFSKIIWDYLGGHMTVLKKQHSPFRLWSLNTETLSLTPDRE